MSAYTRFDTLGDGEAPRTFSALEPELIDDATAAMMSVPTFDAERERYIINTDVQTLLAQPVTDTSKFQSTTRSMQSLFGQVSEALAPMTTRMILGDLSSLDPADVETGVPASEADISNRAVITPDDVMRVTTNDTNNEYKTDSEFATLTTNVARKLNLKTRSIMGQDVLPNVVGHRGRDGILYLTDAAFVFPAEAPPAMTQGVFIAADPSVAERLVPLPAKGGLLRPALAKLLGCQDVVVQEVCGAACAGVFMVTAAPPASTGAAAPPPVPAATQPQDNSTSGVAGSAVAATAPAVPASVSTTAPPHAVNGRATAYMLKDHATLLSGVLASTGSSPPPARRTIIRGDAVLVWGVSPGWNKTRRLRRELVKGNGVALLGDALDPGRWEPSCDTSSPRSSGEGAAAGAGAGAGVGAGAGAGIEHAESQLLAGTTQDAQDVINASTRLRTEVVPAFARHLEDVFAGRMGGASEKLAATGAGAGAGARVGNAVESDDSSGTPPTPGSVATKSQKATSAKERIEGLPAALAIMTSVTKEAHERGIGIRWLGLVRKHLTSQPLRDALMVELIARVFRAELRELVNTFVAATADRKSKADDDADEASRMMGLLLQVVDNLMDSRLNLNMNVGNTSNEKQAPLVRGNLKARLQAKFPFALSADEWCHDHCVWTSLPRSAQRACASSAGVKCGFTTSFATSMTRSEDGSESAQCHMKAKEFVSTTCPAEGPLPVMLRTRKSIQEAIDRVKSRIERCEDDTGLVAMMLQLAALLECHADTKDEALRVYEEARSRAVVEVGALGMVPMYIVHKKALLLLERGCGWTAYEALLPGLMAMNQRAERDMALDVDKAEFAVVPTIPRDFTQMGTKFAMHAGEIMLQMGQIVKCLEQFQSVSNGAFESMWKSLMLCEVFLMLGSIGDAFARNQRLLKNIRDVFQDRGMEFVRVNRLKAYTILEAEGQAVAGHTVQTLLECLSALQTYHDRRGVNAITAHLDLAAFAMLGGFLFSARAHAERALLFAQESLGDSLSLLQAHNVMAWLHYRQGDHDAAKASMASALEVALRLNSRASAAGVAMSSLAELSMLVAPSDDEGASMFIEFALRAASADVSDVSSENAAQLVYLAVAVARNSGVTVETSPSVLLNAAEARRMTVTHSMFGEDAPVMRCAEKLFPAIEAADAAFQACTSTIQARQGPTSTRAQQPGAAASSAEDANEASTSEPHATVAARLRAVRRFLGLWATEGELLEVYDMWGVADKEEARRLVQVRVAKVEALFWRENLPGHIDAASLPLGMHHAMPGSYKSMKAADFQVHEGKACHECRVGPILGKRYFNAATGDNLCVACFQMVSSAVRSSWQLVSSGVRPAGDDECIEEPTAEEVAAEAEQRRKNMEVAAREAPGIVFLNGLYESLFPTIEDPIQFTALQKFYNGGPDPVDCTSVFPVDADVDTGSPAHWQYMTLGFSDLYGDGRLFTPATEERPRSGFGFELCFRLRRQSWETSPPSWPCVVFNNIARYLCKVGAVFTGSDTIEDVFKAYLPATPHAVLTKEPTLDPIESPTGMIEFYQMCVLSDDELRAAKGWTSQGLCEMMRQWHGAEGGPGGLLVADKNRKGSFFTHDPSALALVMSKMDTEGSRGEGCVAFLDASCTKGERLETVPQHPNPEYRIDASATHEVVTGVDIRITLKSLERLGFAMRGRMAHGNAFYMTNGGRTGGHDITVVFSSDNGVGDVRVSPRVVEPSSERRMMIVNDRVLAVYVPSSIARALGRDMVVTAAEHTAATLPVHMEWEEWPGVTINVVDMEEEK